MSISTENFIKSIYPIKYDYKEKVTIVRINHKLNEMLVKKGLKPGSQVEIIKNTGVDNTIHVKVNNKSVLLSGYIAINIFISL